MTHLDVPEDIRRRRMATRTDCGRMISVVASLATVRSEVLLAGVAWNGENIIELL